MGCMVPQLFANRGNRLYLDVLGRNRQPTVPGVNYPDSSHRALHSVGGQSRSLDCGCNRYSYGIVGTFMGFGGKIARLNPPRS
jgi:hypothetical protein